MLRGRDVELGVKLALLPWDVLHLELCRLQLRGQPSLLGLQHLELLA